MKSTKKIVSLVLVGLMVFLMTACGAKEKSAVLTYEQTGVLMEYRIDAKGDVVQKITQTSTLDCSAFSEDQVAAIEASLVEYADTYEKMDGVEYSSSKSGDAIVETIIIDATNGDTLGELADAGLLPIEGDASKISLSKTIDNLEEQGWTLKE